LVAEDEIAGGVEGDAAELGESDVLGGDAGADLSASERIDHYLGEERCGGEGEEGDEFRRAAWVRAIRHTM
jgi:hypothetical protein